MCFNELIRGLAERMGIAGEIEVDSEQRCLLEFDGMGVVIQGVGAAETVALLSPVGMPPPATPVQLYACRLALIRGRIPGASSGGGVAGERAIDGVGRRFHLCLRRRVTLGDRHPYTGCRSKQR